MNYYKIIYSKNAEKFLKTHKKEGIKFFKAFKEIANKENIRLYDIKKYKHKTYNDIFRLRIGKNRAIFRIIKDKIIIYIFDIDSRGEIYKKNI